MSGKKHVLHLSLVFCLVFVLTMGVTSGVSRAGQKKIEWTFNQQAGGTWCDNPFWSKEVPKRLLEATGGRLVLHAPIDLMPNAEVVHGVRDGLVQGAITGTPYVSGEWPLGSFHAVPGILLENDEYPQVAEAVIFPYWERSLLRKYGVRYMAIHGWPGIRLFTRKPIRTLNDFKGMKLRGMGYYDTLSFQYMGASSVVIPWEEAFLSVQRGVVDGTVTGMTTYYSMGFHQYLKYIHTWPVHGASVSAMVIVNEKAWQALPDDLKPVVKKVLRDAGRENCQCNIKTIEPNLQAALKTGCEVVNPSKEDAAKSLEMMKPVRNKWIADCAKTGDPEAGEMLEKIEKFLANYRAKKKK